MSIDSLSRRMSQATREDVEESLDVEARLGELHAVRRRRRLLKAAAGLLAVGGLVLGMLSWSQVDEVQPGGLGRSLPLKEACPESDAIECLDGATVRVLGAVPYTFTVTPGMSPDLAVNAAPLGVDVYATGGEHGGVTILTGVEPADGTTAETAEELMRWVASRPYLLVTPATRGTLDGLETWTVDVRLAKHGDGLAEACNVVQDSCRPLLEQPDRGHWQTGMWDGMVDRFTFLDVPGLGIVAVSSWVFQQANLPWSYVTTVLDRHEKLIRSIDFQLS